MPTVSAFKSLIVLLITALILQSLVIVPAHAQMTPAGIEIINEARADYLDAAGNRFSALSTRVSLIVRAVPRLTVAPDETEPSALIAARETIVRNFTFCNTGNVTDAYFVSSLTATSPAVVTGIFYDLDQNGTVGSGDAPVTINSTRSPDLNVGACGTLLVVLETREIAVGDRLTIDVAMRSNTDSGVSDTGRIINIAGNAAILTSPDDPGAPPRKLVNSVRTYVASVGERLTYSISFRNRGDVAARGVVISDELAAELRYVPGSLRLNTRSLTDAAGDDEGQIIDRRIEVRLAQPVAPNEVVTMTFQASVASGVPAGSGIVNFAALTAINAPAVDSNEAIVILNPFGIVYSGVSGAAVPVGGAEVAAFRDRELTIPAVFNGPGFDPNSENRNPFNADAQGRYSFAPGDNNLATTLYFRVAANDYRTRLIEVTTETPLQGLVNLRIRSLDGMPLAVAGGFDLTTSEVAITKVAALAFNIPMFARSSLEISKTADRAQAEIGENVTYRVDLHNGGVETLRDVIVTDTLPFSFQYINGTGRLLRDRRETPIEPTLQGGGAYQFTIGDLAPGERVSLSYRVRIGVNARPGNQFNVAVGTGRLPNSDRVTTEPARAVVRVGGGVFSMRQLIVGRVFDDLNGNSQFDQGEKGIEGVRLYLANGSSVVTDANGLYSFPAVAEGAQVIEIDPLTIPAGFFPADALTRPDKTWTRLLRAPIGGGLLRQNFALIKVAPPTPPTAPDSPAGSQTTSKLPLQNASFEKPATTEVKKETTAEVAPAPLAEGELRIENMTDGQLIKTPAMNLDVSVSTNWKAEVSLNGQAFGETAIGTTREDHLNRITTYTFVGLGLKPGPNTLDVAARGPRGELKASRRVLVFGRGRVNRMVIEAERNELQASGRDKTKIRIRAFDEWNNPAQDATIAVQTSAGRLIVKPTADDVKIDELAQQSSIGLDDGKAELELVSGNQTGDAEIRAVLGNAEARTRVRFIPETRPALLVGIGEMTIGRNAPDAETFGTDEAVRGRVQLFYRGPVFGPRNLLTVGYDSARALNRVAGQDRLFQLAPLERSYPILGDTSTRFQDTESNSKLYARLDRGRNYVMFGDFEPDMSSGRLLGYSRKLTGVKLHLESAKGDFVTVSGANPDTSFARQIIPGGGLSLVRLDFPDILPGSDSVFLEVRDRRNPEIILRRDALIRGVDYNLDLAAGMIVFLRPISALDYDLNLIQVVVTYEHRSNGVSNAVFTGRAVKTFDAGKTKFGFSMIDQRQRDDSPFRLFGFDFSRQLSADGLIEGEFAFSRGRMSGFGNNGGDGDELATGSAGNAFFVSVNKPLRKFMRSTLKAEYSRASEFFMNPFGATVTPGSARGLLSLEARPFEKSLMKFSFINEQNRTANVRNQRSTVGFALSQALSNNLRLNLGYDFRAFSDRLAERTTKSNLVTVGAEWKPTDRIDLAVKREQNLTEADPSFPNQTTFSAGYRLTESAKLFFTQRLAAAEISPIADVGGTGFGMSRARRETAFGIESKLGRYSNLVGRYQLENALGARDSFAVVGLNNRFPVNKKVALDFGFERGFNMTGTGRSFNSAYFGTSWTPDEAFRASVRYELRDRDGLSQSFAASAAGVIKPGWTTLARVQLAEIGLGDRRSKIIDAEVAAAIRPHDTDRYGVLFSYNHRNSLLANRPQELPTRLRADTLSADGFYQISRRLEFYGRSALRISGDGNPGLVFASTLTAMVQARLQYKLGEQFDIAGETRTMFQPSSGSVRTNYATEFGFWATPDIRFGVGYNFRRMNERPGFSQNNGGFYLSITTKISRLFDLFGTSKKGLKAPSPPPSTSKPADSALAATR